MNIKWLFLIIKFIVGPPTFRGRCQKLTSSIPPTGSRCVCAPIVRLPPGLKVKYLYILCVCVCAHVQCFLNGCMAKASTRVCAVCKYKTGLYIRLYYIVWVHVPPQVAGAKPPVSARRRPGENHLTPKTPILSPHCIYWAINFTILYIPINIIYTIYI